MPCIYCYCSAVSVCRATFPVCMSDPVPCTGLVRGTVAPRAKADACPGKDNPASILYGSSTSIMLQKKVSHIRKFMIISLIRKCQRSFALKVSLYLVRVHRPNKAILHNIALISTGPVWACPTVWKYPSPQSYLIFLYKID